MKARLLRDAEGRIYAVEVNMGYASVRTLAQLVGATSGVSDVRVRRPFSGSGNVRVSFRFQGADYVLMEPFGDSSEYWIGPAEEGGGADDITAIARSIEDFKPSQCRQIWGDLVNLDFRSWAGR